jgi:uncharacterized membrane protein
MDYEKTNLTSRTTAIHDIIQVGLMAAVIFVMTSIAHIPSFMGVIHLGDSMVLLGAVLLKKKKGAISAAVGMSLFDLLNGYTAWAPFTFIIEGLMGLIAGSIAYRKNYKGESFINNLFAFLISGIFMVAAYYFSGVILARFIVLKAATLNQACIIAMKDIPGNIAQAAAGIIISLPLSLSIKKALKYANIVL